MSGGGGPDHEGYLLKLGNFVKSWKRRFFVLRGRQLAYLRSADASSPVGTISLDEGSTVANDDSVKDKPYALRLAVANREYLLIAESELERSSWISALRKAISGEQQADSSSEEEEVVMVLPSEDRAAALLAASVAPQRRRQSVASSKHRLAVVGMWCEHCGAEIREALEARVLKLEVNENAGEITVVCHDVGKVCKALEQLGYICEELKGDEV